MPSLSVVIPAYNEEGRLPRTLKSLMVMEDCEIVVVDDGSTDRTAEVAASLGARVLRLPHRGKGSAVKAGIKSARGDVIVLCDADLPNPVGELERLARIVRSGAADIAVGSRRAEGAQVSWSVYRRFASRLFHILTKCLIGLPHRDTQCGVKAFSRRAAEEIASVVTEEGFAVDVDVLMAARCLGLSVKEVGIRWKDVPGSKVRVARDAWRMFCALLRLRKKYRKMCLRGMERGGEDQQEDPHSQTPVARVAGFCSDVSGQ